MRIEEVEFYIRKDRKKLQNDLNEVKSIFDEIDVDVYLNLYDELVEDKLKYEKIKIELEKDLIEINNKVSRLRSDVLYNEGIELEKRIFDFGLNNGVVLDRLFRCGVVNIEKFEKVKDLMWEKRYRKVYSD
jgi:hypothetical protein